VVTLPDSDIPEPKHLFDLPPPTEEDMIDQCDCIVDDLQEIYEQVQLLTADIRNLKLEKEN
jgi:hypothetical protein